MAEPPSIAARGRRLGLRVLAKVGASPVLAHPAARERAQRALGRAAHEGYRAQAAAGRVFAARKGSGAPVRATTTPAQELFDLTPTLDQAMLRDAARTLADEVIRPAGAQADAERRVPEPASAAAAQMGLNLVGIPAELGGIAEERSAVAGCLVLEELARGDLGIAVALMSTASVAAAIAAYGSADQQQTYMPYFTADDPVVAALALQEPQPLFDAMSPRTTGRIDGGEVVLTGTKALVANAASAELFIVSALIDGSPRLIIVEPSAAGLSREDDPAMGIRAAATGRLVLSEVRVPVSALLGTSADHADAVRRGRLAWSAAAVGTAQAVLDQLIPYTKERQSFGQPIAHRQAVAFAIANIGIELDAMRLVVWKAAARLDKGLDAADSIAQARALVASHGAEIGSNAVQLLGGHGFVKEWDNERWYRELRGAGVLEGTLLV